MRFVISSILIMFVLAGCSKPNAEEMFKKGVDAQQSEQYDAAIEAYQQLVKTYPDSARSPEAFYAIGVIYQNYKRSYHEAIQTFRQFIAKYPGHTLAPSASFLIGFIYNNELKNIDSARIAYNEYIRSYPSDHLVASAQFELEHLGKNPDEILKEQTTLAQKETKSHKKAKKVIK
jgi:TolA-binding protein